MSLTKKICTNWNSWKNDLNYGTTQYPGQQSGAPPPSNYENTLLGDTNCAEATAGEEFDCNIGDVGLFNYSAVQQFMQKRDGVIGNNGLRGMSNDGTLIPSSEVDSNVCKAAYQKPLTIDFGKITNLVDAKISVLQKTWGNKRGGKNGMIINGGVHVDNVNLTKNIIKGKLVTQAGESSPTNFQQTCLNLVCHGDLWSSGPDGLLVEKIAKASCPLYPPMTAPSSLQGQKVGACVATEYMVGPGSYEVIAHAPDMAQFMMNNNKKENVSNGYCFAIWTFHYEEHSQGLDDPQSVNADENKGDIENGYCFNMWDCIESYENSYKMACDGKIANQWLPGKQSSGGRDCYLGPCKGSLDKTTTVVNHEIDIEIPGSWPGKLHDDKNSKYWTPSTWNCNTFLADNENMAARGLWQSQYVIQKMDTKTGSPKQNGDKDSFLATPPTSQPPGEGETLEFHSYRFDWIVPEDNSPPYVEWFFDGKSLFKSFTMIPSRSSRLVVGGWFPHWVQEGNSNNVLKSSPTTALEVPWEQANIYVSQIKYTPDPVGSKKSKYTDYPQNYDQCGEDGKNPVACGFVRPNNPNEKLGNGQRANDYRVCNENCPAAGGPPPPPPKKDNKLLILIISFISVAGAAVIGLIVYGIVVFVKSKKHVGVSIPLKSINKP